MNLDPAVVTKMVAALDEAWEYYQSLTGREPTPYFTYNNLATIAVVDDTCGAGCGFLGFTGIEILRPFFENAYTQLQQNNLYDQIPFYELGRNFWFYQDQLGALDAFVTGFAVFNRFQSMDVAMVQGTSFGVTDFEATRHAILHDMAQLYLSDESTTGIEGLTTKPPANPFHFGTADVAASLFYRIQEDFGSDAYTQFWQVMDSLPKATTAQEAVSNFLSAAKAATGVDYGALFKDGWSLEVGDAGDNTIQLHGGSKPKAAFGFDGNDTIKGSSQDDYLFGGAGDDALDGSRGNDVLVGAVGNDVLQGNKGDDWLAGGPGDDRFVLAPKSGKDVIYDFHQVAGDRDVIDLRDYHFASFDVLKISEDANHDTIVYLTAKDTITLEHVHANQLTAQDFLL
jgi:hypothetical protein